MIAYDDVFLPIFGLACVLSFVVSIVAANKSGLVVPLTLLTVGVCVFWAGLFLGCDLGYRAWQSIPDPPEAAFADTGPMGALLVGWLPGTVFCGLVFGLTRLALRWLAGTPTTSRLREPDSPTTPSGSE